MRRTGLVIVVTSVVALALATVAIAGNGGFLPGEAHSPNAHRVHSAFVFVAIFTGAIFFAVEGCLIAFMIRYRRRNRSRTAEGPQIHGATRLEVLWTLVPVVILTAIGAFVFYKLPGIANAPKAEAANETTIRVEGHQFYWLFRYPNGAVSVSRLVAPADQVVHEEITSPRSDVIHSWWVPDFGGKYDAIPGKVNKTWFKAPVGDYTARCYELCGIQHAAMYATVHVVPRSKYDAFIAKRASAAGTFDLGREEFQGVCSTCHRLDHTYIGPALSGNPLLGDRRGIETLLRNGRGQMPAVGSNWTSHQIDALIAYTKQFSKQGGTG